MCLLPVVFKTTDLGTRSKVNIHPGEILDSLGEVREMANINAEEANRLLRKLSNRLRHELYDLPRPDVGNDKQEKTAPRLVEFISSDRYTLLRDICLKLLIACISVTAIFEASDRPNLTVDGLWAFLGMFLVICVVTYGAKSLCKHYLNKGKIKLFLSGCLIFMITMTAVTIVVEYHSYVHTIHNAAPSLLYAVLATLSSFSALSLYLGGIISLVVLHNWLRTVKRVDDLKAETAKTELQFLQSQINPHFLFNILNNVGVLIYESPDMAIRMISQLMKMFQYQFSITDKESISLKEEISFLENYLLLEQSRKSPFEFMVDVAGNISDVKIPTLLLIPFVENASKHSSGHRDIRIEIRVRNNRMDFVCSNISNSDIKRPVAGGGLGIANTRRRLELIYSADYNLDIKRDNNLYIIHLSIPVIK